MPRKKARDQQNILSRPIIIRVTEATFKRLDGIRKQSRQPTIGEVARRILTNKQLKLFYFDITMNPIMEELALIRKELKAIGININQITRTFNQEKTSPNRHEHVTKVAMEYQNVDVKVDRLLTIISNLAEKWLQKS